MLLSSPADSTFDSGQGSTVYSDSQSSQQSVVLGSLADAAPLTAKSVCSATVSVSEGLVLPHSLPSLGAYPQPTTVSQVGLTPKSPCTRPGARDGPSAVRLCSAPPAGPGPQETRPCGKCRLQAGGLPGRHTENSL